MALNNTDQEATASGSGILKSLTSSQKSRLQNFLNRAWGEGEPIFLYASEAVDRADCVFSVSGDSMEPEYHDGDLVLVRRIPDAPELKEGEIGAFIVGNETYIKEYREDGLHSLNPKYDVMHFSDEESVYLIGRVMGVLNPESIATETDVKRYLAIHGDAEN